MEREAEPRPGPCVGRGAGTGARQGGRQPCHRPPTQRTVRLDPDLNPHPKPTQVDRRPNGEKWTQTFGKKEGNGTTSRWGGGPSDRDGEPEADELTDQCDRTRTRVHTRAHTHARTRDHTQRPQRHSPRCTHNQARWRSHAQTEGQARGRPAWDRRRGGATRGLCPPPPWPRG